MAADDLALLLELFADAPRQGPGSEATTRRALGLLPRSLRIERVLDVGCGTGGSTLVLAADTGAQVTAVDLHAPFLARLRERAAERGLAERVTTVVADMAEAAALGADFDLLWAEGSAYSIGFENALRRWRPLLRPDGCLVVSELVWFTNAPSDRARAFFAEEYPDLCSEPARLEHARRAGYAVRASFRLPADDWRAYYDGLEAPLRAALARHGERPALLALQRERDLYETCGHEYGYLCLVLQAMPTVGIATVRLAGSGELLIGPSLPAGEDFRHIHRAAAEVRWDAATGALVCPKPREWSHARWFAQAVSAVAGEYHRRLVLTAATVWVDVPEAVRRKIEAGEERS